MVKLHRRIQDPAFSDYQTMRVDTIGEAALLGRVYLHTSTGGRPLDVVQCAGTYLAYRDVDGRLFADDVPDYVASMASRVIRTGRPLRRGSYTVRPLS